MKIIFLNGNPDKQDRAFDLYLEKTCRGLVEAGHEPRTFVLRDMKINFCIGCWNCWLKTPGVCVHRDDMPEVYRETVTADLLVFASPVRMGYVTSLTKKANERLIPLLLPYVDLYKGECHHFLRYGKSPDLALILKPEKDTDDEDIKIMSDICRRTALNFQSSYRFTKLTTSPFEEVLHEITRS